MLQKAYLIAIALLTVWILYLYYRQQQAHNKEVSRIERIEAEWKKEEEEVNKERLKNKACTFGQFKDPRSCYFGSNHQCKWNIKGKRCDLV